MKSIQKNPPYKNVHFTTNKMVPPSLAISTRQNLLINPSSIYYNCKLPIIAYIPTPTIQRSKNETSKRTTIISTNWLLFSPPLIKLKEQGKTNRQHFISKLDILLEFYSKTISESSFYQLMAKKNLSHQGEK